MPDQNTDCFNCGYSNVAIGAKCPRCDYVNKARTSTAYVKPNVQPEAAPAAMPAPVTATPLASQVEAVIKAAEQQVSAQGI